MTAHEALHGLRNEKNGKQYNMTLKLDVNKTYYQIDWGFLEGVLQRMGFCDHWIHLVMQCVTTVKY